MTMLEWAGIGAIAFALFVFSARVMRRGLPTLDDDRQRHLAHIGEEKRKISEDVRNISAAEQMHVANAAIADLLRLEGLGQMAELSAEGHVIELRLPDRAFKVRLLMKEANLRSAHRALHGASRWRLEAGGACEEHRDLAALMSGLAAHLRGDGDNVDTPPPHIARRVANARTRRSSISNIK